MYLLLIVVSLLGFCLWLYHYYFYWERKGVKTVQECALRKSLDILFLRTAIWKHVEDIYWKYDEKFIGSFILNTPALFVKDLDLVKRILVKDFEHFPDRTLGRNPYADTLGGHILFLSTGPDWKYMRTKVTQAYSTARISSQFPLIDSSAQKLCKFLEEQGNQPVEMKETSARYSTDVITITAYGLDGKCFSNTKDNFRRLTERIFSTSTSRALSFSFHYIAPFLLKCFNITFLDKTCNKRLEEIYKEQMKFKMETGEIKNDFLDFIIQLSKKESDPKFRIDNNAMVSQAAQYFLAGFETIGSNLCYMLYELARQPEIQTRLRDEVQHVLQTHDGKLTSQAVKEMVYLEMVLNETMRIYPVLPFLDRKVAIDYQIPGTDIILEKGTNVYISMRGMSYDPKYFPDPYKFDPERFSQENKSKIEPFTFMAFGAGPRICIGARYGIATIKVGIARILDNFKVSTCPETTETIDYAPGSFVLAPIPDIKLVFTKI